MKYNVGFLRDSGLEARWSRNSAGAPIIIARCPMSKNKHQRETWWYVDNSMWNSMKEMGILEAFFNHTLLGDIFSIAV